MAWLKRCLALGVLALVAMGAFGESNKTSEMGKAFVGLLTSMKTTGSFSDRGVDKALVTAIIEAGINAPSAQNGQPWFFSAVTGKAALEKLKSAISAGMGTMGGPGGPGAPGKTNGPGGSAPQGSPPAAPPSGGKSGSGGPGGPGAPGGMGGSAGGDPLDNAPIVILISGTKDWPWTEFDCALACDRMVVAAEALGLGSHIVLGPVEALKNMKASDLKTNWAIPEGKVPVAIILLGYPGTDALSRPSERNGKAYAIIK